MLLKWLTHGLSSLLVASLCGLIFSSVLNQTVMNNHYLEDQLTKANAYNRLSEGLTSEVSQQAGSTNNPQIVAKLQSILTPDVLKQKINAVLDQSALYYQGKGSAPSINLSDLAQQAQAAGVPLPANSSLSKPVQIVPNSGTNKTVVYPGRSLRTARTVTIITSIVLAFAVLALSLLQRRYTVLPGVAISVGVVVGLSALVLALAPSLLDHFVKFSSTSNAFGLLGHDLAEAIVRDLARRFGIIAGFFLMAGFAARIAIAHFLQKPAPLPPVQQRPPTVTI